ncbi:MAG: protein jag [Leptolinea sp.]|nr:protein jag [Leptolinea sp.]
MGQEKTTLEIIAPTVDEAVTRGLAQLGIGQDAVDVEVLDSGSKGLFGLGGRQARIRLALKNGFAQSQPDNSSILAREVPALVEEDQNEDQVIRASREIVKDMLEKMKVTAKVSARYTEPVEPGDEKQVQVDINGEDLSILIGRRSETLNALQYISSLIVSKKMEEWVPLVIDIQGYRLRRTRQLQQLARRMADQAVHTGRRQTLEPMPANERRIIHMELSSHGEVLTESTGEEPNRKVTIVPKK